MSDEKSCQQSKLLINLMSVFVFIGLLGAVKPVLFNGGSSFAKYLAKNEQLSLVNEKNVEDYMESALFGEESVQYSVSGIQSSEENSSIDFIYAVDYWIALLLLISSLILLFPKVRNSWFYYSLIPISLWIFCISIGSTLNGGKKFSELAILAHATRWGLPICLWLFIYWQNKPKNKLGAQASGLRETSTGKVLIGLMCFCAGATFAVHGWEALNLNPPFQDLIYNFASIFSISVPVNVNSFILKTVGCMDIMLAISLIFCRSPKLLLWMALWGGITAFSRPLTLGLDAWPEFAMRIANCGLPLTLFLIFKTQADSVKATELNTKTMEMVCE